MSTSLTACRASAVRRRAVAVLGACLLVAGCAPASRTGAGRTPATVASDWLNRTYTVTCDGIVPDGVPTAVEDGHARIAADGGRPPFFDHFDVRVAGTADGDVDGDGAPDAVVLIECAPAPSNYYVQEVQVFASTGRRLGVLPSPRTLQGDAPLPPVYDPEGLSVQHGDVVAEMTAYGPGDSHATGPSVPMTVRWRFDGTDFVRVAT